MRATIFVGASSRKTHLMVNGVVLATEGDLCRDADLRSKGVDRWNPALLEWLANYLNGQEVSSA